MARKPAVAKAAAERPAPVALDTVIETVAEAPAAESDEPAVDEVDADLTAAVEADAEPAEMPDEISAKVPGMTHEGEVSRIDIWLSETRYLLGQLEHEHVGERGEIIAFLRAKLV